MDPFFLAPEDAALQLAALRDLIHHIVPHAPSVKVLLAAIRDLAETVPIALLLKAAAVLIAKYAHSRIWIVYALDLATDLLRRL
jgi:hypothetical protein